MTNSDMLAALKIDLGISTNAYDDRLAEYITSAQTAITREGIKLTESIEDGNLTVDYAAWLWNKRRTGEGLPRMIRWRLNNRLFSQRISKEASQ